MYRFIEHEGEAIRMRVICDRCGFLVDAFGAAEIFFFASQGWAKGPDATDLCPGCARAAVPRKEGHAD